MSKHASPTLIGALVIGALALTVAAVLFLGGGRLFTRKVVYVAYFDESVTGLNTGAPVNFKGVKIGTVSDVVVCLDQATEAFRIPVFLEIVPARITNMAGAPWSDAESAQGLIEHLVGRGLRAQLVIQSFLTGQLAVDLDFHPEHPVELSGSPKGVPELPTVPSGMEKLTQAFENIPLEQLVTRAQATLEKIADAVEAFDVDETLGYVKESIRQISELTETANKRLGPLVDELQKTMAEVRQLANDARGQVGPLSKEVSTTLDDTRKLVGEVREHVKPLSESTALALAEAQRTATTATQTLNDISKEVRNSLSLAKTELAKAKERLGPMSESIAGASTEARSTLAQTRRTLEALEAVVAEDSELRHELSVTLKELSTAARAIRVMADYLERHPEALLHGKRGKD